MIVQVHTYLDIYGFVMNKKFPGVGQHSITGAQDESITQEIDFNGFI